MKVSSSQKRGKKKQSTTPQTPPAPDLKQLYNDLAETLPAILEHPDTPGRVYNALADAGYEIIWEADSEADVPAFLRRALPRAGEILAARKNERQGTLMKGGEA